MPESDSVRRMTPDRRVEIEAGLDGEWGKARDDCAEYRYAAIDLLAELRAVEAERDAYKNAPAVSMDAALAADLMTRNAQLIDANNIILENFETIGQLRHELLLAKVRLPTPEKVRKAAKEILEQGFARGGGELRQGTLRGIIAAALGVDMSPAAPTFPATAPEPKGEAELE